MWRLAPIGGWFTALRVFNQSVAAAPLLRFASSITRFPVLDRCSSSNMEAKQSLVLLKLAIGYPELFSNFRKMLTSKLRRMSKTT